MQCDGVVYGVGDVEICLPAGHQLPEYQRICPDYDRFLPHLAKYVPDGAYVLDVGANCGDTLAGMASANPRLNYMCFEADPVFYQYLVENCRHIQNVHPNLKCECHCVMVGEGVSGMTLAGDDSTKTAVMAEAGAEIQVCSLDALTAHLRPDDIGLIKVDVDGYDYDVLKSGKALLQVGGMPVFFECDFSNEQQYEAYRAFLLQLVRWGYQHFALFDNYGCPVLVTSDLHSVFQMLTYVRRQRIRQAHRTLFYLDILAFGEQGQDQVIAALQSF